MNENDRQGVRALYGRFNTDDVDFSVQSYTVQDDEILLALTGAECERHVGAGLARPNPSVDIFEVAVGMGLPFGDCPVDFGTPVDVPAPLELVNNAPFEVQFTYVNLGEEGGDLRYRLYFTSDPSGANCPGAGCWEIHDFPVGNELILPSFNVNSPLELAPVLVNVPASAPEGLYYVISVIDPDNLVLEVDETNNVAVWNREIEVVPTPQCGCASAGGRSPGIAGVLLGLLLAVRRRVLR